MRPRPPPALQLPSWEEAAHEWLAAADGDVDAPIGDVLGSTVLMAAAERGYTRLVEKALRRGAAVDRQNRCGLTALMSAAMEGQHAVAAALLAHGAAPHLQDHEGKTALMYAASHGRVELIWLLYQHGAEVNHQSAAGLTALMLAAAHHEGRALDALLLICKERDLADNDGFTALMVAAHSGHDQAVDALLRGAGSDCDVNRQDCEGSTPLMCAAAIGHVLTALVLLRNGASVDMKDGRGRTALMAAAAAGHEQVVDVLLQYRADASLEDLDGNTALAVANLSGHARVADILRGAERSPDGSGVSSGEAALDAAGTLPRRWWRGGASTMAVVAQLRPQTPLPPPTHESRERRVAEWRDAYAREMYIWAAAAESRDKGIAEGMAGLSLLRFRPGERVLCRAKLHDEFKAGRVTQVRPANSAALGAHYQVQLLEGGSYVYPRVDTEQWIIPDVGRPSRADGHLLEAAQAQASGGFGGGGPQVLTAEEVAALLSPDGQVLLRDAAEAFGLNLDLSRPETLLEGFIVRRQAAVLRAGEPLYSPARIVKVTPAPPTPLSCTEWRLDPAREWRLDLMTLVDGSEIRSEPQTMPWYLSNADGEEELRMCSLAVGAAGLVHAPLMGGQGNGHPTTVELGRALSCGEGADRLNHLVFTSRTGVAAIDKWRELLREAGLCEDEPAAGEDRLVVVGHYSAHANMYERLHGAEAALVDFLNEITNSNLKEEEAAVWQRWLVELYDAWPRGRREMAVAWLRWLVRPEERQRGFAALCEFVAHENGLSREEHIARDDAGPFSLAKAACDALVGPVGELVADGKMAALQDPAAEGCQVCLREVRSCREWAQLHPCRHWLCARCVDDWVAKVDGERSRPQSGRDGALASLEVCPLCREPVVTRRRGPLNWKGLSPEALLMNFGM